MGNMYERDARIMFQADKLQGLRAAHYFFSGKTFFRMGNEKIFDLQTQHVLEEGTGLVVQYIASKRDVYYLLLDLRNGFVVGDQPYVYHVAQVVTASPDDGMPDLLALMYDRPRIIDPVRDRRGTNERYDEDHTGIPGYYRRIPVRNEGVEEYDPAHALNPQVVNVQDGNGRKQMRYDENGVPIGEDELITKLADQPPPPRRINIPVFDDDGDFVDEDDDDDDDEENW